jgi:hypothetical protein
MRSGSRRQNKYESRTLPVEVIGQIVGRWWVDGSLGLSMHVMMKLRNYIMTMILNACLFGRSESLQKRLWPHGDLAYYKH